MTATEGIGYVFDTFAWIETIGNGPHANAVHARHIAHDVGTPGVVLAEVAHLYETRAPEHRDRAVDLVTGTSLHLDLTPEIAHASGRLRAKLAKTRKGIGLVDCIALETARAHGAKLLTGDAHLKGLDGVGLLGWR